MTGRSREKRLAAARVAVSKVRNNQTVGLGSGDTAAIMVELLAERIRREHLELTFVPSSLQIALKAEAHSFKTVSLGTARRVDLTLDGCDEVDEELSLIKGGGGALVNERVLANLSGRYVVVAEEEKLSERIGRVSRVPVEVTQTAARHVLKTLEGIGLSASLRTDPKGYPKLSENRNLIIDFRAPPDWDPRETYGEVRVLPGVLDVGIFLDEAHEVVIGAEETRTLVRR